MRRTVAMAVAVVSDTMHVVARVGGERFAFNVADVEEVIDAPLLLVVPNAPHGLAGQFTHRDRTISAYDAGWAFGIPRAGAATTALVLRISGDRLALLVDDVEDLTYLDAEAVRPVPPGADPAQLLTGVCLPRAGGARHSGLIGVVNALAVALRAWTLSAPSAHQAGAA